MTKRRAVVAGAGGTLGEALCREFAGAGYQVLALRRLDAAAVAVDGVQTHCCSLHDPAAICQGVIRAFGDGAPVDALLHNAAQLHVAPFAELRPVDFEAVWQACVGSAVAATQAVLPGMLARGRGSIVFSGATASRRGAPGFAAFASAKFALRGLAQSLAREVQPLGVHVAHVVLDGLLRGSASAQRFGGGDAQSPERLLEPADVAGIYRSMAEQPASAWTHEIDLRPSTERF